MRMRRLARSLTDLVLWVRADEEDLDVFNWRGRGASAKDIGCFDSQFTPEPRSNWRVNQKEVAALPACLAKDGPRSEGTYYTLTRRDPG